MNPTSCIKYQGIILNILVLHSVQNRLFPVLSATVNVVINIVTGIENNFNQFCNLLFNTNNLASMNFKLGIGYFDGCKSIIISLQSQNIKRCVNHFVFNHNEISDDHENRSDVSNSDEYFGNENKRDLELEFENEMLNKKCI